MLKRLFKKIADKVQELQEEAEARERELARGFGDPVAERTSWKPLKSGGASFRTHRLVSGDGLRMEFRATRGSMLFYGAFLSIGLVIGGIGFVGFFFYFADELAGGIIMSLVGTLFAGLGAWLMMRGSVPIVFDLSVGRFYRGRRRESDIVTDIYDPEGSLPIERIHALQIIKEHVSGGDSSYYSYELNLVLDDASRVNVVDHGNLERLREDAAQVAGFLGKPLWDGAG